MKPGLRSPKGVIRIGGVYEGPAKYQDWKYKERCDRLMAERAVKAKPETRPA